MKKINLFVFYFFVLFLTSCTEKKVEAIQYGSDYCHHCKMQISDKRFGGALLTTGGITHKYDALECLKTDHQKLEKEVKEIYVVDFTNSNLTKLSDIHLYKNESLRGPMGTTIQGWTNKQTSMQEMKFEDISHD